MLSHRDVHDLLTYRECIGVMRDAFASLARGEAHQPLRSLVRPEGASGFLGLMPAYRGGTEAAFGLKAVCVMPENPKRGLDTHVGVVILSSAETGEPLAIADAAAITSIRTAAVTALATDLLARRDARSLAIIGTGVQAHAHLEALSVVRDFDEVRVAGRDAQRAKDFASSAKRSVIPTASIEEAVRDADVVVTVTNSRTPVITRDMIARGTHINAVGSSVKSARELDSRTVAAASLFVDWRESALNESGDVLVPMEEGAIEASHIVATIGEVVTGSHIGRSNEEEITLFKSLGLAIEDLAAIAWLYRKAKDEGRGVTVEM
jgi:ornithine cyclodeaminase/alanine dehydrogenase-like protein (mu-crystallin family)